MQVLVAEVGEATARGMVADGAACKGNHEKAEGASHHMYVCLWTCKVNHNWVACMMVDHLRRGRSGRAGADASHTALSHVTSTVREDRWRRIERQKRMCGKEDG